MSAYKELEDALSLVKKLCTTEQIQDLLRTRKGHENVRITAEKKDDLVDRNLREAVENRAIKVEEVFELIRAAEENGNQHIYYYKPKSKAIADAITFESIAERLWKRNWKETVEGFPAIRLLPNTFQYSDYRRHPTKPKDWILKIYGHTTLTRFTGKVEWQDEHTFTKEYVEEDLRIVLLARWNSTAGLLEIRVQRSESRTRMQDWHVKVWGMLSPALVTSQFDRWELSKAMAQLVKNQTANKEVYNFRDARVIDAGVKVSFEAIEDEGTLFSSDETRQSLGRYLAANGECNGLTVTWLKQSSGKPQKDLRTLLAARERHEMIVFAHAPGEDLDYVTDQLRRFNK
jgi:hypothetical protein